MKNLILAINIGNTNTHFGVFNSTQKIIARESIDTPQAQKFLKRWQKEQKLKKITSNKIISSVGKVLMASTHPATEKLIKLWSKEVFGIKPLKAGPPAGEAGKDFKVPMPILVEEPNKVGIDRLLNTFAAYEHTHCLTLVADFGTAITFDIVSGKGEFLGGTIAPGLSLMAKALYTDCALLPLIKPKEAKKAIGKNTEQAIQSGIYSGTVGLTKYLIEKITAELGKKPRVIATGGDAELIRKNLSHIDEIIPDLTLKGLVLAYNADKFGT